MANLIKNHKLSLIFLSIIGVLIFTLYILIKCNNVKQYSILDSLKKQFDNKYKTKVQVVDNYLVTTVESSCPYGDDFFGTTCNYNKKNIPLIIIQDNKTNEILSIYEVGFHNSSEVKIDSGNNVVLVNSRYKNNLFKDFSFLTEWIIYYGGSSGLKGMVMFKNINNKLIPKYGYPVKNHITTRKTNITLTDKISGEKYSFPIIEDSYISYYTDLNKNGKTDLLYASWKWDIDNNEAHYQNRPWYLRVFELNNNEFEIAKWWNNGEEYKTTENIGYEEIDKIHLIELFSKI